MANLKNDWQESDIVMNTDMNNIANAINSKLNSDFSNVSGGAVPISNGGTGATSAASARTNLGVMARDFSNASSTLSISKGGTGATTAASARSNLGLGTSDTPTFSSLNLTNPKINNKAIYLTLDSANNVDILAYIKNLPENPTGSFMGVDCTNTPGYNWMLYSILYNNGGNAEWQEIFVIAANENFTFSNFYCNSKWHGWQLIQSINGGTTFVAENAPWNGQNGDLWAW